MSDRPEDLMVGLDVARELPRDLRGRLEAGLLGSHARPVRPEVTEALADALSGHEDLFVGLDGPRPIPATTRASLERSLTPVGRRRWGMRVPATAGAAAACLLAALIGLATLGHGPKAKPTAGSAASVTVPQPRSSGFQGSGPSPVVFPSSDSNSQSAAANGVAPQAAPVARCAAAGPLTPSTIAVKPMIKSVTPSSAPSTGGTRVVIAGTGFSGVQSVEFGGVAAQCFEVVSSYEIDVLTPNHAPGAVTLSVAKGSEPAGPGIRFTFTG